jgi:hypothetical protein
MAQRYGAGDLVVLTRSKSVKHFQAADMPIGGQLVEVVPGHKEGSHLREYKIRFHDGRTGWYHKREFKRIHTARRSA